MPSDNFELLIELHDNIKEYKTRNASRILRSFNNSQQDKFNLIADTSIKSTTTASTYPTTVNLSSTVICTYTLVQYSSLWAENNLNVIGNDFCTLDRYWSFVIKALANKPKDSRQLTDEFSLLNILPLLKEIQTKAWGETDPTKDDDIILTIVELLCDAFANNKFGWSENPHPFIYYKFLLTIDEWQEKLKVRILSRAKQVKITLVSKSSNTLLGEVCSAEDSSLKGLGERFDFIMEGFREDIYAQGKHELYRQLALDSANDRTLFDVKRLVYSLLIVNKRSKYSNSIVLKKALDTIFKHQLENGLLPICHVVNNDFVIDHVRGEITIVPTEVSASPILLSFECFNDMLSDSNLNEELKGYCDRLGLAVEWVKRQLRVKPGQKPGEDPELLGWYPEYECSHYPESWVTGHTLLFLKKYCELLSKQIRDYAFRYLGSQEIHLPNLQLIFNTYRVSESIEQMAESKKNYHSALLFGPPGTGKTTAAKFLANKLDYRFIEITPALFLKDGEDKVVSRIAEIFKWLSRVDKAVILFDEVDELLAIRKRKDQSNGEGEEPDAKPVWTVTAILPLLAGLRERKRLKFILATNNLSAIDPATYRLGRVDLVLPMGGISWRHRIHLFKNVVQQTNNEISTNVNLSILNNITDAQITDLRQQKIEEETSPFLRRFLERTNFVTLRDLNGILMQIFGGQTFKDVQNSKLFDVFFSESGNEYEKYKDAEVEGFHNFILSKQMLSKIRYPEDMKNDKERIINDNIVLPMELPS